MNIKELKAAKKRLEEVLDAHVRRSVEAFEKETSVRVKSVIFVESAGIKKPGRLTNAHVDLHMDL